MNVEYERGYNRAKKDFKKKIDEKIKIIEMKANLEWFFKYDYEDVIEILQELLEEE